MAEFSFGGVVNRILRRQEGVPESGMKEARQVSELEQQSLDLISEMGADVSKIPTMETAKQSQMMKIQSKLIEAACALGQHNSPPGEWAGQFAAVLRGVDVVGATGNTMRRVGELVGRVQQDVMRREKAEKLPSVKKQRSPFRIPEWQWRRWEEDKSLTDRDRLGRLASWAQYDNRNLRGYGVEDERMIAAVTFSQTHLVKGEFPENGDEIGRAVVSAATEVIRVKKRMSDEKTIRVSLPLVHHDAKNEVMFVDSRGKSDIDASDMDTNFLVVRKNGDSRVEIKGKENVPIIVYLTEDSTGIPSITVDCKHEDADGVHAAIFVRRLVRKLGLGVVTEVDVEKMQSKVNLTAQQIAPVEGYDGDFALEAAVFKQSSLEQMTTSLNAGLGDKIEGKLTDDEIVLLALQDVQAYKTGKYEQAGILAYSKLIYTRLKHMRREDIFSLVQLSQMVGTGKLDEASRYVAEFRRQSGQKTGVDNMEIVASATAYSEFFKDLLNATANTLLKEGLSDVIVGKHMESEEPEWFMEKLYREVEPDDKESFGIFFGTPALTPSSQESAATASVSGNVVVVGVKRGRK